MVKNEYTPEDVSPPGDTLAETLEAIGMTQSELAQRTGRPLKTINEIIQGKTTITAETALQLERVLGIPASFWNSREAHYRDAIARQNRKAELVKYVDRLEAIPYSDMVRLGWVERTSDPIQKVENVLAFFGTASVPALDQLAAGAQFRKSKAYEANPVAVGAWLRRGRVLAEHLRCDPFNESKFREQLARARDLAAAMPRDFAKRLSALCAEAGVAVVFVPELPRSRVSGATRWLTSEKAMIQLSLRYRRDDQFWFTFFHEAAHVLLHGKREVFIDGVDAAGDEREQEADRFASDFLIPEASLQYLPRAPFSKQAIRAFAAQVGVSPGIVVGRLQHDRLLPFTHLNDLKRQLVWAEEDGASRT